MPNGADKRALLFPGQGAVSGRDRELVEALRPDLLELAADLVGDDPFARLADGTAFVQPATYCASLAGLEQVDSSGADYLAGHSMGELGALAAAGALSEADGLRLTAERGRLMAELAAGDDDGGMLAVSGTHENARALAARLGLSLANQNSPQQFVLSGPVGQIELALAQAREAGLRAKRLAVSGAFHSPAMEPAVEPFAEVLASVEFRRPRVPVFSSATAQPFGDEIRGVLAASLTEPVRWTAVVEELGARGVGTFVDIGPGKVLAGLVRRTLEDVTIETNIGERALA